MGLLTDLLGDGNATYVPLSQQAQRGNLLTAGEENMPRDLAQSMPAVGNTTLTFAYFTARKSHAITQLRTVVGSTPATGATLCRMGLYTVAVNGDLTLVAACANDTSLWTGASGTVYTRSIVSPASYDIMEGQRYACAVLCVGASATLQGATPSGGVGTHWAGAPRLAATVGSQLDLPASVLAASLGTSPRRPYMEMLP